MSKHEFKGNLAAAMREARLRRAKLTAGKGEGSIRKWSNGVEEVVYVPEHAYSSEGWITVRPVNYPAAKDGGASWLNDSNLLS